MGFVAPNPPGNGSSATDPPSIQQGAPDAASNWLHSYLKKQMTLSKRRGGWFRLEKRERSMFSLALRLKASFRGHDLLKAMVGVLKKLMEASDAVYSRLMRGVRLAWAFSTFAVLGGCPLAKAWWIDLVYARYLGSQMGGGKRWCLP